MLDWESHKEPPAVWAVALVQRREDGVHNQSRWFGSVGIEAIKRHFTGKVVRLSN